MDIEEFEKYLLNSIIPLFPDVMDKPRKRVLIKIDNGPSQSNNIMMCAGLRNCGVYPKSPKHNLCIRRNQSLLWLFRDGFCNNIVKLSAA